jgi:hypothetical protein
MARDTHIVESGQEYAQHERCSQSEQASTMSVVCFVAIGGDTGALVHGFL